jgi:MoaA/NifB/PqqE/SkfB family radical SAM enzyme
VSCNYCGGRTDCPNESRPGAASRLLSPEEALERYLEVRALRGDLKVVGVAGPGEPLHRADLVLRTFSLVRDRDPNVMFCLSTNGLMLPMHLRDLHGLGLRHLTVTVNAVDPAVGAAVYGHVDYLGERYTGEAAASVLLAGQLCGISMARRLGIEVKVNTVLLKGVNDSHVAEVARRVAALGVGLGNLMGHLPVPGSVFAGLPAPSPDELEGLRRLCGGHLPQMTHCRRCRADASGLLGEDGPGALREGPPPPARLSGSSGAGGLPIFRIAVASKSSVIVDSHFAHAERFYIYESDGRELRLVEHRKAGGVPGGAPGGCGACGSRGGAKRPAGFMPALVEALSDCHAVVSARMGDSPRRLFEERGILAVSTLDAVDSAVLTAARAVAGSGASRAPALSPPPISGLT